MSSLIMYIDYSQLLKWFLFIWVDMDQLRWHDIFRVGSEPHKEVRKIFISVNKIVIYVILDKTNISLSSGTVLFKILILRNN